MKKNIILIFISLLSVFNQAQSQNGGEIWGMTMYGGAFGGGTIFKTAPDGSTLATQHSFNVLNPGIGNAGSLTLASDGKFYGFTTSGGTFSSGVIYEYDPATNKYLVDYNLNTGKPGAGASGFTPKLELSPNGKLYGNTISGGVYDKGIIFEFDPISKSYSAIYQLQSTIQGLIAATNGKLYALTYNDGLGNGTIFSFDPSTSSFAVEYKFNLTDGGGPLGKLLEASDGKFYGVTALGGSGNSGVIFQFDITSKIYTKLYEFNSNSFWYPVAPLVESASGVLCGATTYGGAYFGGCLYQFNISNSTTTKLYDFSSADGINPWIGLMKASNGLLYGVTTKGGANNAGVLFEFNPANSIYSKKYDFPEVSGYTQTILSEGTGNKLYGIQSGFAGSIFEYTYSTNSFAKRIDFQMCPEGCSPRGTLFESSTGKVYGVGSGGLYNGGVLFELDLNSGTPNTVVNFTTELGTVPDGGVIELDGTLYGVCQLGGLNGGGTLYSYDPEGTIVKLVDFSTYGISSPNRSLVIANGKLYGTTRAGGEDSVGGILFEYDPKSKTFTNKFTFTQATGRGPRGLMVLASNGKLYGTTNYGGGNNMGVIFEYDLTSNTYSKKLDFSSQSGSVNFGPLIEAPGEKLYFTTQTGGANNGGTILEYSLNTGSAVTKYDFNNLSGFGNTGGLLLASNGKLYGNTFSGGNFGIGTFYEFDLSSKSFTKKFDFSGPDGATPDLLVPIQIKKSTTITLIKPEVTEEIIVYPNPTKDEFSVINPHSEVETHLSILSANGAVIDEKISIQPEEHFSLKGYPQGLYLLKIQAKGNIKSVKIVKQ